MVTGTAYQRWQAVKKFNRDFDGQLGGEPSTEARAVILPLSFIVSLLKRDAVPGLDDPLAIFS